MRVKPGALRPLVFTTLATFSVWGPQLAYGSSHREAPFITEHPKVDASDFYMFNSYEPGREGYVTIIANYNPLQDAYGGPNYFTMDPEARYDIKIDNDGDSQEDLTFRFRFKNMLKNLSVPVNGVDVPVPLVNIGQVTSTDTVSQNVVEQYEVRVFEKGKTGRARPIRNATTGSSSFEKPLDYVGMKTFPDYPGYASSHIYSIRIPRCSGTGRMFVGQRKDPFAVNLGETFDLVNYSNPVGSPSGARNSIADKNVTSLILEIPRACLVKGSNTTIGAWTTAYLPKLQKLRKEPSFESPAKERGELVQVSRLGMPLVNELVIGLKDKDKFNASEPKDDAQFATYVTHPTLPVLLQVLYPSAVSAPPAPRNDLLSVFVTGVPGLNKFGFGEMLRLNTAIPAVQAQSQNNLGVLGGDTAGFPNGRRPGDDVVDISLRAVVGALLPPDQAPSGTLPLTDGAKVSSSDFDTAFPYLKTPVPGSPDQGAAN